LLLLLLLCCCCHRCIDKLRMHPHVGACGVTQGLQHPQDRGRPLALKSCTNLWTPL
jgi:hypothetical protein